MPEMSAEYLWIGSALFMGILLTALPNSHATTCHLIPMLLLHLSWDRLEVVQIPLLMPRGQLSEQGPATVHQVRPSFVKISGHHKELLLPTQVAAHGLKVKGIGEGNGSRCHGIKSLVTNLYQRFFSFRLLAF